MAAQPNGEAGKVAGVVTTLIVHALVIGGLVGMHLHEAGRRRAPLEEETPAIEAGLAIKAKSAAGKKSRLPPKDVAPKVKPKTETVPSRDAPPADPNAKQPDESVPPDKQDAKSVFDKYRNLDTETGETTTETPGGDERTETGKADGSEHGTLADARGDPYVGELVGRMIKDFTVPATVTEETSAWGCVKLDAAGKIVDRWLHPEHKSGSPAFNSAVEQRLRQTTDMEEAVPDRPGIRSQLLEGLCVVFKS